MTEQQTEKQALVEEQDTALIHIRPGADPRITAFYQEGVKILEYAEARVIESDQDIKAATDDLSIIAGLKKAIEERRKEYVGPINEHMKVVNAAFKEFADPLLQADTITRQKVLAYRAEQERIRQEQERINGLREEAAQAEMGLTGELSEPVGLVEVASQAPVRYRQESGMLSSTKTKKWEVTALNEVPLEYLMIDAAKVGKVVRAGIPSIPGIRIWEEDGLRVAPRGDS